MKHPFKGQGFIYYILAWAIIIVAHAMVLNLSYQLPLKISISDAVVCNLLLAGLGFSLWWAIQYFKPSNQSVLSMMSTFAVIVVLGTFSVSFICDTLLYQIYSDQAQYMAFSANVKPWRLVTSGLYLSVIILVYYLLKNSFSLSEKEKQEAELQTMLKQSELEMLKFQINPHFIFNSLNSISSLTISDPDNAREMVIKLSSFLRGSLGQENTETHSLQAELEQMNLYLDIEKVRFGDRLKVNQQIDKELLSLQVPNMILQPLYENAIKYGVYEQLDAVTIDTTCTLENSRLVIKVSNDYDSNAAVQKGKGIGLKNVRSRLEIIYGFPDLVTLERGKDKFCVKLEIPQGITI
ncbi:hypothetical protein E1176_15280 [Fulvivirga sp. RKSG066]|uniref:sensor histidine kinase n=1 Tax=Fulvivirga aurantia TaxID=2529383 RepID=UPI0012BC9A9A|nr:histidine kinase [Fulvivirga aurantia]MTI22393.1 hypothetical protein [Fulvivirga aurantia]